MMIERKASVIFACLSMTAVFGTSVVFIAFAPKSHPVSVTQTLEVSPAVSDADIKVELLKQDLGLWVLEKTGSREVPFELPSGTPKPDQILVGKSCCTEFKANKDWDTKPGGVLTIRSGLTEGTFDWTATGLAKDGRPIFEVRATASVSPLVLFQVTTPQPVQVKSGTIARFAGEMICMSRPGDAALSRPNVSAEPGATFTWQGNLQTERTVNGFMRARQKFVLTVTAGNDDSLATKSFQASWPANGPQPIRWSVTLESQPTYRLEPRALVWKPTEEGVKQLVLTSEEASLSTRSIVVEGDVKYEIRKSSVDDKQIVIDVECNRRDRGRAGTLKLQVSGTQIVVPVYRLGGDA